jgi:hypothetical protein
MGEADALLPSHHVHGDACGRRRSTVKATGGRLHLPHHRGLPREATTYRRRMADPRQWRHRPADGLGRRANSSATSSRARAGLETAVKPLTPQTDRPGPYRGTGNDEPVGGALRRPPHAHHVRRHGGDPRRIRPRGQLDLPGHVTAHGHPAADRFWTGLRAAFPSATFHHPPHHRARGPHMPPAPRSAGASMAAMTAGAPSARPRVRVLRPRRHPCRIRPLGHAPAWWGLRREWVLFDETAIWKQILLHG